MKKNFARNMFLSAVIVFVSIVALELSLKAFFGIKSDRVLSDKIGWRTKGFFQATRYWPAYGEIVKYSTTANGFRIWGNRNTDQFRILVIGDSTTQAVMIPDGEAYYDYLKKQHPEIELFVYGSGGYGTLQEYMILEEFIGKIRPNLVIWQMDDNDFINNYRELESRSYINNNHMKRPYFVNGGIVMSYPSLRGGWLYDSINGLALVKLFKVDLSILRSKNLETIEEALHKEHPLFLESRTVTTEIMKQAQRKASSTPIVAFAALARERLWMGDVFEEMAHSAGWLYVPDVSRKVLELKDRGVKVDGTPGDAHWSKIGHLVAGQMIDGFLIRAGMLKLSAKPRPPQTERHAPKSSEKRPYAIPALSAEPNMSGNSDSRNPAPGLRDPISNPRSERDSVISDP